MKNNTRSRPQVRLFRSDRLEALTVISPRAFVTIWAVHLAIIALVGWGTASVPKASGLVVAGLLIWSLFEYALHRFLFHWRTQWQWLQTLIFVIHGNHHTNPNDPGRSLMPAVVSLPISWAIWAVCALALGPSGTFLFLGMMVGYVIYDGTHYACHQFPVRSRLLQKIRRHHVRHHRAKDHGNFAVTVMGWDRLFGTLLSRKDLSRKGD